MFDKIKVKAQKGEYSIDFCDGIVGLLDELPADNVYFIVDEKILHLYDQSFTGVFDEHQLLVLEATEEQKSIENLVGVYKSLIEKGIRKNSHLVAIGGGIIQDISAFVASTLYRGIQWTFVPTTLLAQADSCMGSKSSINIGGAKNLLGTFYPPERILISSEFIRTLSISEIKSGIGEMLKVHAIESIDSYKEIANDYDELLLDTKLQEKYIYKSLAIKKYYVELDEFDQNVRNIFNYGHSFGHAIEAATDFQIPHGVAVSIGMDCANFVAWKFGFIDHSGFLDVRDPLIKNYAEYNGFLISFEKFFSALKKDKKNSVSSFLLILPRGTHFEIQKVQIENEHELRAYTSEFLSKDFIIE